MSQDNNQVILRKLKLKDAPFMYEWMHDQSVVGSLKTNFSNKTMADCETFILNSEFDDKNVHFAITDNSDEYLGTVSIKHINGYQGEFAITIRKCAMHKGYAFAAMKKMLEFGFKELRLSIIYWCVSPKNERAVRFYDKNMYERCLPNVLKLGDEYTHDEISYYIWYCVKCK